VVARLLAGGSSLSENYRLLLEQSDSIKVGLLIFEHHDGESIVTDYVCDGEAGYNTETTESVLASFLPRLESSLNVSSGIDSGEFYGGVANQEFGAFELNNLDGLYDEYRTHSIDGLRILYLVVGWLRDGTRVGIDEALESPVVDTRGVGKPRVGERSMILEVRGELYKLDSILSTKTFSPPCPLFPGTSAGNIDYGDVWDWSATARVEEYWIKTEDPATTGQLIVSKDSGSAGMNLDLGTAGSGALRWTLREHIPSTTTTAAGLIEIDQDHHVAIAWDPGTATRTIYVDRVAVATTSAIAGSPTGNAANYVVGSGFKGTIARGVIWGARTATEIDKRALWPVLGTEAGLVAAPVMEDGQGDSSVDAKSGSVIEGTLGPGVEWSTATYYGEDLAGEVFPVPLGFVQDQPLTLMDPGRQMFFAGLNLVAVPTIRSNHTALSPSQYAIDLDHGVIEILGGLVGTYSADVAGPGLFGAAVEFDGVTGYAAGTVPCPAGSMAISCLVRPDTTSLAVRRIAGWTAAGATAGIRSLSFYNSALNRLRFVVVNDANVSFAVTYDNLQRGKVYSVKAELDVSVGEIRLLVDGLLGAVGSVTGTFATVLNTFAIARRSETASEFFPGLVGRVAVWSATGSAADAERDTLVPVGATAPGLAALWPMGERTGSALANSVGAGPSLALFGDYAWTHSRITPADLVNTVCQSAGYTAADLYAPTTAGFIRSQKGDSQWLITGSETAREVIHKILLGVHAVLRPRVGTRELEIFQVTLPSGEPADGASFTGDHLYADADIEPIGPPGSPVYRLVLLVGRNWTSMRPDEVAGLVATDPARYNFATREWRRAPSQDLSILDRFPQARAVELESCLIHLSDGLAEAARVRPFYGPERERYVFVLSTTALGVSSADQMLIRYDLRDGTARLGLGSPGRLFLVLGSDREGYRTSARGLA
jgi:hypothetical protein